MVNNCECDIFVACRKDSPLMRIKSPVFPLAKVRPRFDRTNFPSLEKHALSAVEGRGKENYCKNFAFSRYGSLLRMCLRTALVVSSDDSGFFQALTVPPTLPL